MKQLLYIVLIFYICIVSSCGTTKYIEREVPIETIKTEYKTNTLHDSVYIQDSTIVYMRGDTVFKEKIKYKYKNRTLADTIIVRDTIEKPVNINTTEIKEVNKLTKVQQILIFIGALTVVIALILLAVKIKLRL